MQVCDKMMLYVPKIPNFSFEFPLSAAELQQFWVRWKILWFFVVVFFFKLKDLYLWNILFSWGMYSITEFRECKLKSEEVCWCKNACVELWYTFICSVPLMGRACGLFGNTTACHQYETWVKLQKSQRAETFYVQTLTQYKSWVNRF